MHHRGKGVHHLSLQQDVHLDQVGHLLTGRLVVQRGIALGAGLELIEEVEDDLGQRQRVTHLHPVLGQIVHTVQRAAPLLTQFHDRTDEVGGGEQRGPDHRFVDRVDLALGEFAGVGHRVLGAVLHLDPIDDVGRGGDQFQVEFALQTGPGDLQVQQPQETTTETEAQGDGTFRLEIQGGVVELQLVQGIAQDRVIGAVDRVQPREHHRPGLLVTGQHRLGRFVRRGDGVTDLGLTHVLHAGDDVADLTHAQTVDLARLGRADPDLQDLVGGPGRHHLDALTRAQTTVDHTDIGDHTAVGVVHRVEDHRTGRRVGLTDRRRYLVDDLVEKLLDALTGLGADLEHVGGVTADDPGDLLRVLLRLGGRQVDLVQHRDDREVVLQCHVQVRQGLCLDALGGVHQQDRTFARGQRARHLVGEVDVARGVDQAEDVGLVVQGGEGDPHRL